MLQTLISMFMGRRRGGIAGMFDRRRHGGAVGAVNAHRGASALGTIATIAAPFVIKKLMAKRSQRAAQRQTV
ncbi:MAG: hypothetical protein H0T46_36005 [Deltaproteobacteria bacterium]|nr:hypothetical protein [Deltaproteobacteria bacterium]